jgi:CubicO group peptidase (beta-lactamase class C family)
MKRIRRPITFFVVALLGVTLTAQTPRPSPSAARASSATYVPSRENWETRKPSEVGMDEALLAQAIEYAKSRDTTWARDDYMADQIRTFGRPLGPVPKSHGRTNGLVIRHGYIVAEFGDTSAVEPTYSVAKSYLSTILGLTINRGMIKSITDPVAMYIKDGGYDSPHNAKITWEYHARQTSEWEGTMFGRSSTFVGHEEFGGGEMKPREIHEPGSYYEYNDVRINRLSLSLLRLWKRSIPDVLKTEIMDRIGASNSWQWLGYDNADVDINGKMIKSVPGGTRWGGGIWMNSRDHARFGLLMLRKGSWNGQQLVPASWVKEATTPGGVANSPDYGYLWWLNSKSTTLPKASFEARGNGSNTIYIDPENELVIVWRWHGNGDFFKRVVAAVKGGNNTAGQ